MRKLETVEDLLEAMRERHQWVSDSSLARALKVPQPTVASWRTGARTPGDDHALRIAEALDISPLLVIAIAAEARAKDKAAAKMWRKMAEQVARGTVTTFAALAVLTGGYTPSAKAADTSVYITSNRRRRSREALQPTP